jgi:O-antigen/teichoic acid export membrane protein
LLGALNYLGPKIAHVYAEEGAESLRKFVLRASVGFACLLSLFCLAMALWGGPLVGLLYGSKYAGNGLVVALLATNLALLAIAFLFSRALFATERADLDFWVSLLALPIMITLGLWLVKSFGLIGAALGLLVANLATSVVRVGAFMTVVNRMCRDRARQ